MESLLHPVVAIIKVNLWRAVRAALRHKKSHPKVEWLHVLVHKC